MGIYKHFSKWFFYLYAQKSGSNYLYSLSIFLAYVKEENCMKLVPLYEEFLRYMLTEKNCSKATEDTYRRDFKRFCSFLESIGINPPTTENVRTPTIREYIFFMGESGLKATTLNKRINSLRSFYHFLISQEYIEKNPMSPITSPKKPKTIPKYFTEKDLESFFNAIKKYGKENYLRDYTTFLTYALTGLRKMELAHLKVKDINLGNNTITVECGKGNKSRIVPINPPLTDTLFQFLVSRLPLKEDDPVFVVSSGKAYSPSKIQELFSKYRRLSHINQDLTVHSLRHSYASLLLQNGVGLAHISTLLGHSSFDSTKVYLHTTVESMREDTNQHPLCKKWNKEQIN